MYHDGIDHWGKCKNVALAQVPQIRRERHDVRIPTRYEREAARRAAYEEGMRDGMLMAAFILTVIVLAGICGGIECGRIPLPF